MKQNNNIPQGHKHRQKDSISDLVKSISPIINRSLKLHKKMLAEMEPVVKQAIVWKNQDINYLCRLADSLSEMVNYSGIGKDIYNKLLDYIHTFDPTITKWYRDNDKEMNGLYDNLIEKASALAKELHKGQKDKAGVDYFEGHLSFVGNAGYGWKDKIVGFLHDAAEDTPHTVSEIIQILKEKSQGVLQDDDAEEMETALNLLNSSSASSRKEYIANIKNSALATRVKLNDLKHNMDISRLPNLTEKDIDRLKRYKKEYRQVLEYLGPVE
jgi:hypothetical protein